MRATPTEDAPRRVLPPASLLTGQARRDVLVLGQPLSLLQSAIAYLGKAKHPLDDPDRMFDPGPHFGLGAVFRPLDPQWR
jgi:hypothetical protein